MFQFDLEAVLNYRAKMEEQCQVVFADSLKRLQAARDILECLKKEKQDLISHIVKMQEDAFHADVIQRHFAFIEFLKRKEENQAAIICKMEDESDAARQALLEAVKKRKALETLREKRMAAYVLEAATRDRKELDDLTIIKFANGIRK
ncbi:MAG: flagellar export protein FliJ [Syntrophaceae bacterium]